MKSKIILTAASTLILSACFLGGDDDSTSSSADMSKPISYQVILKDLSYTANGNKATVFDIDAECTVGGGFKQEIDTSYYIYLGNNQLQYLNIYSYSYGNTFTRDTTIDTLVGGNSLENSTWYRVEKSSPNRDSSAYTLKSGKIYYIRTNLCPAADEAQDLIEFPKESRYGSIDPASVKATGCGTLTFNTTLNGKSFAVTQTFSLGLTDGLATSFTETLSANGTTCTKTETNQDTPINTTSCKAAWADYTAKNGTDTTNISSYWFEDYIYNDSQSETFKTCRNKALGITDSTMLKRKLNRIFK